jgi:hypothetical protein
MRALRYESKLFLTKNEARKEFPGLAMRALDRACATGELVTYKFDSWRRIHRADLVAWIARHRHPAPVARQEREP